MAKAEADGRSSIGAGRRRRRGSILTRLAGRMGADSRRSGPRRGPTLTSDGEDRLANASRQPRPSGDQLAKGGISGARVGMRVRRHGAECFPPDCRGVFDSRLGYLFSAISAFSPRNTGGCFHPSVRTISFPVYAPRQQESWRTVPV